MPGFTFVFMDPQGNKDWMRGDLLSTCGSCEEEMHEAINFELCHIHYAICRVHQNAWRYSGRAGSKFNMSYNLLKMKR